MSFVYRVQDGSGRGPYRPGFSHLWTDVTHALRNPTYFAELGWEPSEMADKFATYEKGGCGKRTVEQLRRWFSEAERARLNARGYSIVRMKVDRILAESDRQLVFARKTPLKQNVIVVSWLQQEAV